MAGLYVDQLLTQLVGQSGSDLHLVFGQPPVMRIHGKLTRTEHPVIERVEDILYPILNEERRARLEEYMELDLSYEIIGVSRFRVNCFKQRVHMGAVLRAIPFKIKPIDDLGLPQRRGPAERVEGDVEPGIDVAVEEVEAVAELAGRHAFLEGLRVRGRAVLVGAADIEGLVAPQPAETGEDIGGKHLYEVPEVGDIVHIGKG